MSVSYAVLDVPHLHPHKARRYCQEDLLPDGLDTLLFLRHAMVVKEGHDIAMPPNPRTKSSSRFLLPLLPSCYGVVG
jgi:hypothetical protein